MAVLVNDVLVGPITPAAGVSTISLDFDGTGWEAGWLLVYKGATATPLVLGQDYTVANAGTVNATVTLTEAANGTDAFAVYLATPLERPSDLQLRGEFRSGPFNTELDRLWQRLQYQNTLLSRSLRVLPTDNLPGFLPSEPSRLLGFDGSGGFATYPLSPATTDADAVIRYATVAAMLASDEAPRGEGSLWEAGGFRFTEAASAATDHDQITAGLVKLYFEWDGRLAVPAAAFGVSREASNAANTAGLQAAVDWASAKAKASELLNDELAISIVVDGSFVHVLTDTIILKGGAGVIGGIDAAGVNFSADPTSDFTAKYLFDTPDGAQNDAKYVHLVGVGLIGSGTDTLGGVRLRDCLRPRLKRIVASGGFAEACVEIESTAANGVFHDIYAKDAWRRALTGSDGYVAAINIAGTDHHLDNIYGQISDVGTGGTYTDGRKAGVRIAGNVQRVGDVRGELSETGVVIDGADRIIAGRIMADLNYGPGLVFANTATQNNIGQVMAFGNSRAATGTHDGVEFKPGANHDNNVGLVTIGIRSSVPERMRHAVNDSSTPSNGRSNRIGPVGGTGWVGARLYSEDDQAPQTPHLDGPSLAFAAGDTTPDVSNGNNFRLVNTGAAITLTTLDNMPRGKSVKITCFDTTGFETTLSASGFVLPGGADLVMRRQQTYEIYKDYDGDLRLIQAAPVVTEFSVGMGQNLTFGVAGSATASQVITSLSVTGLKANWPLAARFKTPNTNAANAAAASARNVDIEIFGSATADGTAYLRFVNHGDATILSGSTLLLSQSVPTK